MGGRVKPLGRDTHAFRCFDRSFLDRTRKKERPAQFERAVPFSDLALWVPYGSIEEYCTSNLPMTVFPSWS